MEQRRLRLGDILDDYCPRERRVTNHAVVAMIEEDVKQTRCTTCDSEHPYKGARVPRRRKKETPAALYKEVLAGMPEADEVPAIAAGESVAVAATTPTLVASYLPVDVIPALDSVAPDLAPASNRAEDVTPAMRSDDNDQRDDEVVGAPGLDDMPAADGPVHRPLIRATLPRPEGQKDARPVPDFTVRHAPGRGNGNGHSGHGNGFRNGDRMRMRGGNGTGQPHREPNGNRAQGPGSRFHGRPSAGGRPPMGRAGGPSGFRSGDANGKRGRGSRG
jgi:hypothetical protein